jgi:hypothetical protein
MRDTTNDEKRSVWREAQADEAEWLPPAVANAFLRATAYAEPAARDHAAIHAWGAFTHVGA